MSFLFCLPVLLYFYLNIVFVIKIILTDRLKPLSERCRARRVNVKIETIVILSGQLYLFVFKEHSNDDIEAAAHTSRL